MGLGSAAQRPPYGNWVSVTLPVQLSSKSQWHTDGGYRTLGESLSAHQILFRTGYRYFIRKNINAAGGVAVFFTRTSFDKGNKEFGREFRLWEEVNAETKVMKNILGSSRIRAEQRFFERTDQRDAYKTLRLRLRVQFRKDFNEKTAFQVSEEYMVGIKGGKSTFDQNRISLSLILKAGKSIQFQPGWMWLQWPESVQQILTLAIQKNIMVYKSRLVKI